MKNMRILIALLVMGVSGTAVAASSREVAIKPTQEGSTVSGTLYLEETAAGLKVTAQVQGVSSGKHGFHFHENGNCADQGMAAGGHFNPAHAPHGLLAKDGLQAAHAGDMGNIDVGADGSGRLEVVLPGVTLSEGPFSVSGKAVVLHEKEDDFGQPTGNAGGRIGCGVID